MSTHGKGTFEVKGWEEKPFSEIEGGPKLTHASVTKAFHGDVEGEGTLDYLMVYHADGTAGFVGFERVTGSVGGKSGSFVLQHSGSDDGTAATDNYTVVPGSGTGELRGLRGEGRFYATRKEAQVPFTLEYELE
jgi:hypothetical protein